jgi:hypothetical protein
MDQAVEVLDVVERGNGIAWTVFGVSRWFFFWVILLRSA